MFITLAFFAGCILGALTVAIVARKELRTQRAEMLKKLEEATHPAHDAKGRFKKRG